MRRNWSFAFSFLIVTFLSSSCHRENEANNFDRSGADSIQIPQKIIDQITGELQFYRVCDVSIEANGWVYQFDSKASKFNIYLKTKSDKVSGITTANVTRVVNDNIVCIAGNIYLKEILPDGEKDSEYFFENIQDCGCFHAVQELRKKIIEDGEDTLAVFYARKNCDN